MLHSIVAHLDFQTLTNNNKFLDWGKNLQRVCRLSDELKERVSKGWLRELHRRCSVVNLKLTSASERKTQKGLFIGPFIFSELTNELTYRRCV